jgi:hypothetical protein
MFVGDFMKAAHAIIAWTPAKPNYPISTRFPDAHGQVIVGEWRKLTAPNWALKYANLAGATSRVRRSMTEADALKALGRDFAELRADGIPADVINAAFAVIDGWQPR